MIYFAFLVILGVLNSIFARPAVPDWICSISHAVLCVLQSVIKGQSSMLKLREQAQGPSSGSDSRLKFKAQAEGSSSKLLKWQKILSVVLHNPSNHTIIWFNQWYTFVKRQYLQASFIFWGILFSGSIGLVKGQKMAQNDEKRLTLYLRNHI